MSQQIQGGCACGIVRYALASPPDDCGWCHCTICQRISGAPAMVFATVPVDHFQFTSGQAQVGRFRSSSFGQRQFCTGCGSPLTMQVAHQPETIDIAVATLDDPDKVPPSFHIFDASRIAWFETTDDLPRHEKFRPDTRGLEGTEPPM
ncbi:MAG TPA: GFA family protein [Allosphingosinicella sp.]|nr:GFA family protein [Allosphingosinicella sp.]